MNLSHNKDDKEVVFQTLPIILVLQLLFVSAGRVWVSLCGSLDLVNETRQCFLSMRFLLCINSPENFDFSSVLSFFLSFENERNKF